MVEWTYVGLCTLPTPAQLPSGILNEWEETLKAEAVRIKSSLTTKIPNEARFLDRLATPSSDRYAEFLATVGEGWTLADILMKQRVKLKRSYPVWSSSIEECFKEGGYFGDAVTAKKPKFGAVRYTLGAVGHRPSADDPLFGVWNPVAMGALLLRGDTRPLRYLTPVQDIMTIITTFQSALDPSKGALITPFLIGDGVRGAVWAQYMLEAGEEAGITAYLKTINDRIKEYVDISVLAGAVAKYELAWDATDVVKVTAELTTPPTP